MSKLKNPQVSVTKSSMIYNLPMVFISRLEIPFFCSLIGVGLFTCGLKFSAITSLVFSLSIIISLVFLGYALFRFYTFSPFISLDYFRVLQLKTKGRGVVALKINWCEIEDVQFGELSFNNKSSKYIVLKTHTGNQVINLSPMWYQFKIINEQQIFSITYDVWKQCQSIQNH